VVLTELFPPAIGGSGELLANIYTRFTGIPVTVLTGPAPGTASMADPASTGGVRVHRDVPWSRHWGLVHPVGCWTHLARTGRLLRLSRRGRAVVHCGRVIPEGLDGFLSSRLGGGPYVCWAHGEEIAYSRHSRELRRLMAVVYRHAAATIANSRSTASRLIEFGAPSSRVVIAHPGVDANRFTPAVAGAAALRARLADPGGVLLLTVGRLQRRKGQDLVLRALAEIGSESPSCRYAIVGTGPEEADLRQLAADLGVTGRVTFAGAVAPDELPAYYAAADVFVHPNRIDNGDFEGFGIVLLEAAASGLPVIAGTTGGTPEAVEAGTTGLLVTGDDSAELASALRMLVHSPERRQAMGAAGRSRAIAQFSWDRSAAIVAATHERVAAAGHPPERQP
jgi:phosphatidylinositol alpha-1,6-mannosyltransferase